MSSDPVRYRAGVRLIELTPTTVGGFRHASSLTLDIGGESNVAIG